MSGDAKQLPELSLWGWRGRPRGQSLLWPPPLSAVEAVRQQRDRRGLLAAPAHLHLHQRAGLRLPPPQPQKRLPEEALRRPEVRREEGGGGGLRPLHPGLQQGDGGGLRGEVAAGRALRPRPCPAPALVVRMSRRQTPRLLLLPVVVYRSWNTVGGVRIAFQTGFFLLFSVNLLCDSVYFSFVRKCTCWSLGKVFFLLTLMLSMCCLRTSLSCLWFSRSDPWCFLFPH